MKKKATNKPKTEYEYEVTFSIVGESVICSLDDFIVLCKSWKKDGATISPSLSQIKKERK